MRKEAEAWLTISAEDLQSAEVLFERHLYRMACYHAQQSVEKVFKALLADHEVEVVTGVNLPMLIKLATLSEEKPLEDLASFIKSYGQRNISVASEILPDEDA